MSGPRARAVLGATFIATGVLHFLKPRVYEAIVPAYLPSPRALVYASGVAEAAGGAGVLHPRSARLAGWWLLLTLAAVFPANVEMAVHAERFRAIPEPLLWARLPLQALFGWIVWRVAIRRGR